MIDARCVCGCVKSCWHAGSTPSGVHTGAFLDQSPTRPLESAAAMRECLVSRLIEGAGGQSCCSRQGSCVQQAASALPYRKQISSHIYTHTYIYIYKHCVCIYIYIFLYTCIVQSGPLTRDVKICVQLSICSRANATDAATLHRCRFAGGLQECILQEKTTRPLLRPETPCQQDQSSVFLWCGLEPNMTDLGRNQFAESGSGA